LSVNCRASAGAFRERHRQRLGCPCTCHWPAAEQALLAVLKLDADHKEARHNLAVLRARLNPPAGAA
jgi:hypothetical protein